MPDFEIGSSDADANGAVVDTSNAGGNHEGEEGSLGWLVDGTVVGDV